MRLSLVISMICLLPVPVFARIGETEAQCVQRYGDEITTTDAGKARSAEFLKDDFVIVVTFLNGTSVCEAYKKQNTMLSDSEITEIIGKNGGQSWNLLENGQPPRRWGPGDGPAEPGASFQAQTLVVWGIGGRNALAILKDYEDKQTHLDSQKDAQQSTSGL